MEIQSKDTLEDTSVCKEYGFSLESDKSIANSVLGYHAVLSIASVRGRIMCMCARES